MIEVAGEQATAGVGDAQRAVHKHFQLDIRALLPNFRHVIKRNFARQNHACDTHAVPKTYGGVVHGVGLYREMNRHIGPSFADH